jgi:hypothetical protein
VLNEVAADRALEVDQRMKAPRGQRRRVSDTKKVSTAFGQEQERWGE